MAYKDKDKQREANRQAKARQRAKGMTSGMTSEGVGHTRPSCSCHTQAGRYRERQNEKVKVTPILTAQGNIRVSKPGDADYVPQCETTKAFIENRPKKPETGKRGKDIKCFVDLPVDVQQTIDRMSVVDGKIDKTIKANRTAIAINYQHLYSDRYYPQDAVLSGVVTGKPGDADTVSARLNGEPLEVKIMNKNRESMLNSEDEAPSGSGGGLEVISTYSA